MKVTVCWSPGARSVHEAELELAEGTTLGQALDRAGLPARPLDGKSWEFGVWGRRVGPDHVLRDADRVEAYRALTVDPKVARRERFRNQGARTAGLFANRRPGAKPGY